MESSSAELLLLVTGEGQHQTKYGSQEQARGSCSWDETCQRDAGQRLHTFLEALPGHLQKPHNKLYGCVYYDWWVTAHLIHHQWILRLSLVKTLNPVCPRIAGDPKHWQLHQWQAGLQKGLKFHPFQVSQFPLSETGLGGTLSTARTSVSGAANTSRQRSPFKAMSLLRLWPAWTVSMCW